MAFYNHLLSQAFPCINPQLAQPRLSSAKNKFLAINYRLNTYTPTKIIKKSARKILASAKPLETTRRDHEMENNNIDDDDQRRASAAKLVSWIDLYLPDRVRAYAHLARVDKLTGSWLLSCPMLWSAALAMDGGSIPDMKIMALFGLVSLVTHSLGCTINDYFDRDIDAKIERSKSRPLARGALTPFQALCFLGFQLLLGYALLLPLNNFSRLLWVSSLPLIFTYPLMKRITYWPQAYLGLAVNYGALYGWSAIKGSLNPSIVFPLYLASVLWTLTYDTIYAHQDKEDDLKVGVKSTALLLGDSTKESITVFGLTSICSLVLAGFNANIGWPFYALVAAASTQLAWQIWAVDLSNPSDCLKKFKTNSLFGAIIFIGILLGRFCP